MTKRKGRGLFGTMDEEQNSQNHINGKLTNAQMHESIDTLMHTYTDELIDSSINRQMHEYTDTPIHESINTPMHESTDVPMDPLISGSVDELTDISVDELTNATKRSQTPPKRKKSVKDDGIKGFHLDLCDDMALTMYCKMKRTDRSAFVRAILRKSIPKEYYTMANQLIGGGTDNGTENRKGNE